VPEGARHSRIEVIELLRALAACSVMWFHFTSDGRLFGEGWLRTSGTYGWLGVEVFFVISGFIILYSMHHGGYRYPAHLGTFLLKRMIRLEPPYLIAVVLTLALWFASASAPGFRGPAPDVTVTQVLLHVGYLNAFFDYPWLSPVFWSLAIEFQFYICTALAFPLLAHNSSSVRLAALAIFCALGFVIPDERLVFSFMSLFALGIVTFWRFAGLIGLPQYVALLAVVASIAAFALGIAIAAAGLAAALTIAFVRVRRHAVFAYLGGISYSLYLLHVPIGGRVVNLGARFADSLLLQCCVLLAAIAASLVAAHLMYRLIERPAQKWSSALRYAPFAAAPRGRAH
jgi:peptidoglycan/LPS O-acetylase OafA/YrhL